MKYYLIIFFIASVLTGCEKQLNQPVADNISTINSLEKCEQVLNNTDNMGKQPAAPEISADNYYFRDSVLYSDVSAMDLRHYLWEPDLYKREVNIIDYSHPYKQINHSNEVLSALERIPLVPSQQALRDYIEGACLFYRSYAFYNLLQLYARPYDAGTAATDTGISLVLTLDKEGDQYRASMQACYDQVIKDLRIAAGLLPLLPDAAKPNKPSRVAAWGLLARTYLSMRVYSSAAQYADSCLKYYDHLLNYQDAINIKPFPFGKVNHEVLYQAYLHDDSKLLKGRINNSELLIDSSLYDSYDSNDLRKTLFYRTDGKKVTLHGSYSGSIFCFGGIATDELYLIRAECAARHHNLPLAMATLNELLEHRYKPGTFHALSAASPDSALALVLQERRKELAFRGLRWTDLRRLNKENPVHTIRRLVRGVYYVLQPNDLRYTFPFPDDVLADSKMVQNPRK
ncbi:MAG: RagB/SusD family nutrient uptake outer membrane protein [Niastella sp.]|nr:RagB/SusD family nutrient uptake outer membrane protein [Niastella sp.]